MLHLNGEYFLPFSRIKYTTLMRTNRRLVLFFCVLILSGPFFSPLTPVPATPAAGAPSGLSAVSTTFSFTMPDPKRPGRLLYELRAASANGQSEPDGFHGALTSVWARLYQNGAASAILTAPRAQGGSSGKTVIVTGFGGVVVKSLLQPGTKLTADTVVWYASLNKMVATGHVYYHDGKTGATMTGPRMNADSRLKTIQIVSGHGSARL